MTSILRMRSFERLALAVAVLSVPAMLSARERTRDRRQTAEPTKQVELFAGIEKGDIEVLVVPKDSSQITVRITNKTDELLSIKLPEAFAAVPVLAQLGGPGGGMGGGAGGGRSSRNGSSGGGMGGGQQSMGGGMGGMGGGMGGMGMGGMGMGGMGMFNVAPEKVGQLKVQTVCLEHGKHEPQSNTKYRLEPIEKFSDKPALKELCKMLGRGELNQRVAQAAAWHVSSDMSWEKLIAKQLKFANGLARPYFGRDEIQAAMRAVSVAALAAEQSVPKNESSSVSQNAPNR